MKVFVTGCFDLIHSGHIAFLEEAAGYGDLYVGIGSDKTIVNLKGRYPIYGQAERKYILNSIKYVKECNINSGYGLMDFEDDIKKINPDIFIVNEDGNSKLKEEFCKSHNIEYKILKRTPHNGLPPISTTSTINKNICEIPYRIDLAGGWLDQPGLHFTYPGKVIVASLEPIMEFNERSGMATSTRNAAIKYYGNKLPNNDCMTNAEALFKLENEPGLGYVSGTQDALGICFPGLTRHHYDMHSQWWPVMYDINTLEDTLEWVENHIQLIPLWPRENNINIYDRQDITKKKVKALSEASDLCWEAIMNKDVDLLAKSLTDTFNAQVNIFPNTTNSKINKAIQSYKNILGYKLTGAGAGGYIIAVVEEPQDEYISIKIRRGELPY